MLARVYRLTEKKEYDLVKNKGKLHQLPLFGLIVLKRKDNLHSKFGFVVSTKIDKRSIVRNRVKRALKETVRQSLTYLNPGYDVVFLVKPEITKKYTKEIMAETRDALRKVGVMK